MRKMTIKDWEILQNIISITKQENFELNAQKEDVLQTIEDNDKQKNEEESIKDKFDRVYFSRMKRKNRR